MGNDLIIKLLLDNSNFEKNLKGASSSLGNFKKTGANAAKSTAMLSGTIKLAGSTVTKFLAPLGLALSAMDLFTIAVNSNKKSQEQFDSTLSGVKDTVKEFFSSLSTGDWSAFDEGITNAIKKGKDYALIMKRIQESIDFGNTRAEYIEEKARKNESKIDSAATVEDVSKYLNEAVKGLREGTADRTKQNKQIEEDIAKALSNQGVKGKYSNDELMRYVTSVHDVSTNLYKDLQYYNTRQNNISDLNSDLKSYKKHFKDYYWNERQGRYISQGKTYTQNEINNLEWKGKSINDILNAISKEKGGLSGFYKRTSKGKSFWEDMKEMQLINDTDDKALTSLRNSIDGVKDNFGKIAQNENDIISLQNAAKDRIKELKEEKNTRTSSYTSIDNEKISTQAINSGNYLSTPMLIPPTTLALLEAEKKGIINQMNNATSAEDYVKLKVRLDAKNAQIADWTNGKGGMGIEGLDISQAVPLMFESTSKNIHSATDNISMMTSALGDLQSAMMATGESSKAMGAAMATANFAATMAMMIATMVEKSKTSLTIWDWIAGIAAGTAAVVTAAASLSSVMKYADGGIVGGNRTIGDMNIARVNSGEMILNNHQQRNLFNLLNNGGGTSANNSGKVEFRIEGKQLVGVLNNYNGKRNKVL